MAETGSSTDRGDAARRVAIVTGGSRGIGRSAVLNLAARGLDVIFTYNSDAGAADEVTAEARKHGGLVSALRVDVSEVGTLDSFAAQVRAELAAMGVDRFDYLVNNAGIWHTASFAETTVEDLDRLYAVNVRGVFFVTQQLVPLIRDGGRIVNLSSGLVRFVFPGKAAYAVSKGAIEPLTRYLATELAPRGIRVNTLAPGATATDFSGGVIRDDPEYRKRVGAITALGRPAEPEEIGRVVAALLSDDTGWINGERIEASGGMKL
ncbi:MULTISPECIES: SDR family NAD(P)-dependent oxidoreductase [Amycolatopsis]|uniref:NAD(P)-dependent dehydrogenase, short-chain alcohol dehydrogenase family n=2 Tax=Amycolatopsis TaxID=1813 RepID=A0A1I4BGD9_9PSEU|nr:SDR family oxidoreductase [Amycolatopsis sacchari]SFK67069.1 NAD(P)-dependent dehydrogenase, short-chain alcohol dehydrogenase family [Amycolatopsis sacchari]